MSMSMKRMYCNAIKGRAAAFLLRNFMLSCFLWCSLKGGFMERSQLERLFALLFRNNTRRDCLKYLEKLKKSGDKDSVSPEEVAKAIFPSEVLEESLVCFLLLVSTGDGLALRVVDDLGKHFGDGKVSVDEAVEIMSEVLDELIQDSKQKTEGDGVT
jgi:hypothetical protein